jgi:TonB-dependent receptor
MIFKRRNSFLSRCISLVLLSPIALVLSGSIFAQQAATGDEIDEVIVTGIRASLQDAISKKRNADDIRDVINAEDVGKLPDQNVADALQRITGIQIGRSMGEGSEVAIRGISSNRVELNGQTQVGTGASRSISTFANLPAEMFSSLEVIKSPSADETEGGLGGIIRLNTRKPLDGKGLYLSGNIEGINYDRVGETSPAAGIYTVNRWDLDSGSRFGMSLNVTQKEYQQRQDKVELKGWSAQNGTGLDLDGNGIVNESYVQNDDGQITSLNDAAFTPLQTAFAANLMDRTSSALRTSLQYMTADGSDWMLDASYAESERRDLRYQHTTSFNSRTIGRDFRDVTYTADQTAIAGTVGNIKANGQTDRGTGFNIQASRAPYDGKTTTFALTNERMINDRLTMKAQASYAKGEQVNDQLYATVVGGKFAELPFVVYDFGSGNDIPTVIPHQRGTAPLTDETRINFMDPLIHKLNGVAYQDQHEQNIDTAFKVDFDYDVDFGAVNLLEFGLRVSERTGDRYRNRGKDNQNNPDDGILGGLFFDSGNDNTDLEDVLPGRIITMPYGDDMFDGASGDWVTDYLAIDADWIMNMGDEMEVAGGTVRVFEPEWGYSTQEDTQAAYLKANFAGVIEGAMFDGVSYSGNIGGRYVKTDTKAGAYDYVEFDDVLTQTGGYNTFLPSFNATFAMTDDFLVRLAAYKTIGRPRMADIAPLTVLYSFTQSGRRGNVDLTPEQVTNYDISFEYYIPDGGLLSLAWYSKSFKNAIEDGFVQACLPSKSNEAETVRATQDQCPNTLIPAVTQVDDNGDPLLINPDIYYNLNTKLNVGTSRLNGIEFAFTKDLSMLPAPFNNTGVQLNYTFTDSSLLQRTRNGYPVGLQDFSENSYNAIAYYEDDRYEARIAYNWRDEYYDTLTQGNAAAIRKPYGQLDFSARYKFNKKWSLGLSVVNINNEANEAYQEIEERFLWYKLNDTQYRLTLRGQL